MVKQNSITLETQSQVTFFNIQGNITAESDPFLKEAYEIANQQEASKIILKFDPEAYINSGGISLIIQLLAQTKTKNQLIGITGISDHFEKIFSMVGITKFAKIYDTTEQAIESLTAS